MVLLDNLSRQNSARAAGMLRNRGAWFLFLLPLSPNQNLIEMAFSKLKALVRNAGARHYEKLWQAVGHVCALPTDEECSNVFWVTEYGSG